MDVVEWVTDEDGLRRLREEWSTFPRPLGAPFLRHAWFDAWWRAFGEGELQILTIRRDGRLAGVLPLTRRARTLSSLANRHSQLYSALALDDDARASMASAVARRAAELRLEALAETDEFLREIERETGRAGRATLTEALRRSPFVTTSGDFESFLRSRLSADTRRSLARSRRRLERDLAAELHPIERVDDVGAVFDEVFALERAGWKGRDGTAVLSAPSTSEFFRELGFAFAAAGILRLSTIRVAGTIVAFELSALDGNRLWSMKASYDERVARYSPGRLLRLAVIQRCFELGLETNEMLGADEPYKMSFATGSRPVVIFRSYARAPMPLARFAYRRHVRPGVKSVYLNHGGLKLRMALQRSVVRLRS